MAMQRNKGVLEPNAFLNTNQRLVVAGISQPLLLTQRDAIPMEQAQIETPDKRRLPSGRNNSGEFSAQFSLADDSVREEMLSWYEMGLDRGSGVNANYKRDGILSYLPLFQGSPASEFSGAGRAKEPFQIKLIGLWLMKLEFSEFDMSSDGEIATGTITLCFDDVQADRSILARTASRLTGGLL